MLKISITDTRAQRRLLVEGRLVAPWVAELRTTWDRVKSEGDGRQVVIDIGSVTLISQEGENALLQLMNDGAKFRCCSGVLTKHVLTMPQAIKRSSSTNAKLLGFTDRGSLLPGFIADVIVFDPETIADKSTYEQPTLLAVGMKYVLVNGVLTIDDGRYTGATAGKPLRRK